MKSCFLIIIFYIFSIYVFSQGKTYIENNINFINQSTDSSEVVTYVRMLPKIISIDSNVKDSIRYPQKAVKKGLQGIVRIECYIDDNDSSCCEKILTTSDQIFNDEAIKMVKKLNFMSAVQGENHKVGMFTIVMVHFYLKREKKWNFFSKKSVEKNKVIINRDLSISLYYEY